MSGHYNTGVLSRVVQFAADAAENFFLEIPAQPAVFALRGDSQASVLPGTKNAERMYISKTANLRRRLQRLLGPVTGQSKRLNLRDRVREIEFTPTGSDFESQFLLYRLLRQAFPKTYASRLRLRPAPLVKLHLENEYPRASVTTRLGKLSELSVGGTGVLARAISDGRDAHPSKHSVNVYYGPFPSRAAAEKFASDSLDFFKMRRCVDDLHPDPAFPGCVYSEMKMCLAPCFKGCTDEEYQTEVGRVQNFFDSGGESLRRELEEQREHASADLAFEEAAAIHTRIEKLKPVLGQLPEIVQRIDRLKAIVIQPSAETGAIALFYFANVNVSGPFLFSVEQSGEPRSMEARLQELLAQISAQEAFSTLQRIEHLAMFKRWYYRSQRTGEVFFADREGKWPLRRIVRGIGRVFRGERDPAPFSATQQVSPSS